MTRSPFFWLILILAMIATVTALGPNVRVVYLHGVWVWASLAAFLSAGVVGVLGLALRRLELHLWSHALGRTGLLFWITYLPISMWAMQANWNGLFLAEPRWKLAVVFAVSGLLLQVGVSLLEDPAWASAANIVYVMSLFLGLQNTQNVMHPPAPILSSNAHIQLYYTFLLLLALLAAWQTARWWRKLEPLPLRTFRR
jgi:hypothetical protein